MMIRCLLALTFLASLLPARELRDLPYVESPTPEQKVDLYLPDTGGDHPVVIAIHGGGWTLGQRDMGRFVQPKARWLNRNGFIFASIGYRLAPAVQHPGQIEDVCAAIAWVQKNIARYQGDPRQIYLLGHSAGAQLAALAAIDKRRLVAAGGDPSVIRGVILLDGAGYDIPAEVGGIAPFPSLSWMYPRAFTSDPAVQRDASPIHHIDHRCPPFLILHPQNRGHAGRLSHLLSQALQKQGGFAAVIAVPGKTHGTISKDLGKRRDPTTRAVAAFLGLDS